MRFHRVVILLAAAAEATRYAIPYDGARFKNAPGPGLLSIAGVPLPSPFNGLTYDSVFSVINLNKGTLVRKIVPSTSPNVLIANGNIGSRIGNWKKAIGVSSIDFNSVAFTCAAIVDGQPMQVKCTVLFEGSPNANGISKQAVVTAPANGKMTVADLSGIYGTSYLSFAVTSVAGLNFEILSVSLLIDTAKYSTNNT